MYPAQALFDGLYTEADLPDEIVIKTRLLSSTVFDDSIVLTRSGSEFINGDFRIFLEDRSWVLSFQDANFTNFIPCLIDSAFEYETPEFEFKVAITEDTFADTYKVTFNIEGDEEFILTRCELCLWANECDPEERTFTLRFVDGQRVNLPSVKPRWDLDYFGVAVGTKIGPLNTPVGTYTLGSVTAEVSEV
jgi:hypothetical protein